MPQLKNHYANKVARFAVNIVKQITSYTYFMAYYQMTIWMDLLVSTHLKKDLK